MKQINLIFQKYKKPCFLLCWGIYLTFFLLSMVELDDNISKYLNIISRKSTKVIFVCLFLIIISNVIEGLYPNRIIVFFSCSAIVLGINYYITGYLVQPLFLMLIAASYGMNERSILCETCFIKGIILFGAVICSLFGVIPDILWSSGDRVRHGLGLIFTTMGPMIFLSFGLEYFVLRGKKVFVPEVGLFSLITVFFYYMTNTRMVLAVSILFLLFLIWGVLTKYKIPSICKTVIFQIGFPVLCCLIPLILSSVYRPDIVWLKELNDLVSSRLILGNNAIKAYGIKPFGQAIVWVGANNPGDGVYNYVDSSYLQLLLTYGPFFLIYSLTVYWCGIRKAVKENDFILMSALITVLVYAMSDPQLMTLGNTSILLCVYTGANNDICSSS